jgi:hypothetical protein
MRYAHPSLRGVAASRYPTSGGQPAKSQAGLDQLTQTAGRKMRTAAGMGQRPKWWGTGRINTQRMWPAPYRTFIVTRNG